jgi:protein dithiol oxidoreductase (disulfide-forming)
MQLKVVLALALFCVGTAAVAATPAQYTTEAQTKAAQRRAAAPAPSEGNGFVVINPAGHSEQAEVVEFFSYTCPACYKMENFLGAWKQEKPSNVNFKRMHVVGMFGAQGDLFAKAFYTAEVLGIIEKVHKPFFDLVHQERKPPKDEKEVAAYLAKFGVKEETVLSTMKSFAVNMKMGQTKQAMQKYKLRGVPGFIINDKYFTDGATAQTNEMLDKVLSDLPLR